MARKSELDLLNEAGRNKIFGAPIDPLNPYDDRHIWGDGRPRPTETATFAHSGVRSPVALTAVGGRGRTILVVLGLLLAYASLHHAESATTPRSETGAPGRPVEVAGQAPRIPRVIVTGAQSTARPASAQGLQNDQASAVQFKNERLARMIRDFLRAHPTSRPAAN